MVITPRLLLAASLLALAAPAPAQDAPSPYTRAIAAGYKALMLCGARNSAAVAGVERSIASIEANELKGTYPDYDALLPTLNADVSPAGVSVPYDTAMPPRIARAEGLAGCRLLPIGAKPAAPAAPTMPPRSTGGWPLADNATITAPRGPLAPVLARAFDGSFGQGSNTTAVLVLGADGRIAGERYAEGFGANTPQRTWSVAKSIAGTIIGAAAHKRQIDPAAPAPVPEWQREGDPRRAITLDQLLRMASGLHSDTAGNRTDALYFGGTAVTEEAVAWPLEVPPGTRFRYANNDTLLAIRALRAKLGRDDFARDVLLDRIAMRSTIPEQDWQGNYMLSSQVWSTPRDFARLGTLWLNDGVWQGERILPEGWVRYMTTPSGPQPTSGAGYGATLWLFGPDQGLPAGSYAAQGNRGQYIMVIPARRLVIVRRGEDAGSARFDIAAFAAAVAGALR
ncbi:serine hydrolase [Sphingomonas baiyangensis]|uniref:Serine hydrolase n=2 Tax=Sphingomonas baiyangensis TaxID=2572576 RepID=A0A4U1L6Z8_9SPHN|nr:serine hydrolase [Sphingomonas baiyangensis]